MHSDEVLYCRYLGGDEAAAAALVERHGDALVLYLTGYLKDTAEAEDLMIEAFSRLFVRERPITQPGAFKAYLYKTARHLALRHGQKHRPLLLRLDELDFDPPGEASAELPLLQAERSSQLAAAMSRLKPDYREALYLVYFENMRYRDAAAVMGKSEQQFTKLVHRGKQSLKTLLEQEGFVYANE